MKGLTVSHWFGLLGPAKMPVSIQTALHEAVTRALKAPALQGKLESLGLDITPQTPAQFAALMETDTVRWAKIVKERNIKAD